MKGSINWQITRCQLVMLCKGPVSRFHPPKAPHKHQVNLTRPCEVGVFGQHLRTSTGWGLQSIMALHQKQNPIWSPALVTASHKEGVGSTAFSLNYFKDKGKKAEMSINTMKYCLPLSWLPPNLFSWSIFPSLTPSPAHQFPPSVPELRLPCGAASLAGKGESEDIFKYNNTYASCHGTSHTLLHRSGWKIRSSTAG